MTDFDECAKLMQIQLDNLKDRLTSHKSDLDEVSKAMVMNDKLTAEIKSDLTLHAQAVASGFVAQTTAFKALSDKLSEQEKTRRGMQKKAFGIALAVLTSVITAAVLGWLGFG